MSPKNSPKPRDSRAKAAAEPANAHATRETVESIVIAFVLAFLFRTFEAEAFVIPTGSMAPTLMGMHKDVDCAKCGHRYRVTASEEADTNAHKRNPMDVVGGVCRLCRFPMPMRADNLSPHLFEGMEEVDFQKTYNGDRILVNKYIFTLAEPERFDVIVFHFPGDAETNYIKRLVGLPRETLRVFQGDLYVGKQDATRDEDFTVVRKPADKVLAVRQLVHDTDYDPLELYDAGWPLRWHATSPTGADGWQLTPPDKDDNVVRQSYSVDRTGGGEAWLRYRHTVPDNDVWRKVANVQPPSDAGPAADQSGRAGKSRSQLIMDFNAYNARVHRAQAQVDLWPDVSKLGIHWVGDLIVEADVKVAEAKGELLLDLVEAGKHFTCRVDLATGKATLGGQDLADFAPAANTPLSSSGRYNVQFANIDDQLLLWVDGELMQFDQSTEYDAVKAFGSRRIGPKTSMADRGDLEPAGIGAAGSKLTVTRLKLWRDIYYIADSYQASANESRDGRMIADYDFVSEATLRDLRHDSSLWDELFLRRRHVDFKLGDDQFFVMGDNSAESSDARLWQDLRPREDGLPSGQPGGAYLERRMLIGKAVCVYWPHAWYTIPKTPIPVWPNFRDMRLVR
jgi:signal peptidase I